MVTIVTIFHIIACMFLIGVVLLQQGKGADMGAVFGGSSSTIFGSGGAGNFLTRLTTVMAIVFMFTSMTLTFTGARRMTSTLMPDSVPLPEPPPLAAPQGQAPEAPAAGNPEAAPAPQPQAGSESAPPAAAPQAAEPQAAAPVAAAPQEAPATN